jgi:DnaD/phage-associated family protein
MRKFNGFTESESFTRLPGSFFHRLLGEIQDAAELKVTLYFLWRAERSERPVHALREADFDPQDLGLTVEAVRSGLEQAVRRGSLLRSESQGAVLYFLNSPRGRAAAEAHTRGELRESGLEASGPPVERPNIFVLYEANIGPLTPLIADALKDAEATYPVEWIEDAIGLAVKNNKRSWKYCEAILKRWKDEGRGEKQDRRNAEKDRGRYVTGEYADYVEH